MHSARLSVTATLCCIFSPHKQRELFLCTKPKVIPRSTHCYFHSSCCFSESMVTAHFCFPYMKQGQNLSLFLQCHGDYFKERSHASQTHHN